MVQKIWCCLANAYSYNACMHALTLIAIGIEAIA